MEIHTTSLAFSRVLTPLFCNSIPRISLLLLLSRKETETNERNGKGKKSRNRPNGISNSEILSHERLTKLPIGRSNVPGSGGPTVTACEPERERLTNQDGVGLPVLTPVTAHAHPPCVRPLNACPHDIPCTSHVCDQNQVEVSEAVDGESDPSAPSARHPTVRNGYDSSAILSNLQEHGHGEVEVSTRRVTPPAVIVRKGVIRGAEVGRRYQYRRAPGMTPLRVSVAL